MSLQLEKFTLLQNYNFDVKFKNPDIGFAVHNLDLSLNNRPWYKVFCHKGTLTLQVCRSTENERTLIKELLNTKRLDLVFYDVDNSILSTYVLDIKINNLNFNNNSFGKDLGLDGLTNTSYVDVTYLVKDFNVVGT